MEQYISRLDSDETSQMVNVERWDLKDSLSALKGEVPDADLKDLSLKIQNKIFINDFDFTGNCACQIIFDNCYFNGNINCFALQCREDITFKHCFVEGEIYIKDDVSFEKVFNLIDLTIRKRILIAGGTFDLCRWSIKEYGTLKISGGAFRELNIGYWGGGSQIAELSIDLNTSVTGLIRVTGNDTRIKILSIFRTAADISISLEDISVNLLSLTRYRNDKYFRISNLRPLQQQGDLDSELSIVESYLGKAEFYNIDFSEYKIVNIYHSHLSDASFIGITWKTELTAYKGRMNFLTEQEKLLPGKVKNINQYLGRRLAKETELLNYIRANKEAYRQLKYVYAKQGDTVMEQWFHVQEMKIYAKLLTYREHLWTKLIVNFSYTFSKFGQSIFRPLVALIVGSFLLFFLFLIMGWLPNLRFSLTHPDLKGFELGIGWYFKLINPLRKYDDQLAGFVVLFDLLVRIWASLMIYNIIRAARRFIK